MVSEGLLSPGWEERPAERREPGWRVFPYRGGSGGSSAWSRLVLPVPCGPAWVLVGRATASEKLHS